MPDRAQASRVFEGLDDLPRAFEEPVAESSDGPDPVDEALERGREEGRTEGRRLAIEEMESRVDGYRKEIILTLKTLTELQETLSRQHLELMRELALETASRIVRERIEADDPVALRALEEAVEALPKNETVHVRVHPDDLAAIERELSDEIAGKRIDCSADETVSRGGCVVESEAGTIDATIETAEQAAAEAADGIAGES